MCVRKRGKSERVSEAGLKQIAADYAVAHLLATATVVVAGESRDSHNTVREEDACAREREKVCMCVHVRV